MIVCVCKSVSDRKIRATIAEGVDSFDEQVSKLTADDIKRIAAIYFKTSAACAGVVRGSPPAAPAPAKQQ